MFMRCPLHRLIPSCGATLPLLRCVHQEIGDHLRHAQTMRALWRRNPWNAGWPISLSLLLPKTGSDVRLRREDIAELVGCIPETAIRVIADFSRRGILRTGWKRIALLDRISLERIALSRSSKKIPL
jgi:CRP-like cAMP-binding protein